MAKTFGFLQKTFVSFFVLFVVFAYQKRIVTNCKARAASLCFFVSHDMTCTCLGFFFSAGLWILSSVKAQGDFLLVVVV